MEKENKPLSLPKWVQVLLNVSVETVPARLAKNTNLTYSHVHAILKQLAERKFVTKKTKGRCSYYTLTKKGLKLQEILINLTLAIKDRRRK